MLPLDISTTLAWSTLNHEPSAFVDADLTDHHGDLLFTVESHDHAIRYLLLEHQSSNDTGMPLRMHIYQGQVWHRFRKSDGGLLPPIIPLLVSHAPGGWASPSTLGGMLAVHAGNVELAPFIPNLNMVVTDLTLSANEELDLGLASAAAKLTLWLLRDVRDAQRFCDNLRYWAPHFSAALHESDNKLALEPLTKYILVCGPALWETFHEAIHELAPDTEEIIMTMAEQLIAKGLEEGLAKGREEGREEGRVDLLSKQLAAKFGGLAPEFHSRLAAGSPADLDLWAQRVLFCGSLDDVFAGSH
jgi:predicted transposase/invertase (TIGR01784 family)